MAEEERRGTFSADDARRNAGVNQYTEGFLAKIKKASNYRMHAIRLIETAYITDEQLAALYELEGMGFRIERVALHYVTDVNMPVPDSFYAFW